MHTICYNLCQPGYNYDFVQSVMVIVNLFRLQLRIAVLWSGYASLGLWHLLVACSVYAFVATTTAGGMSLSPGCVQMVVWRSLVVWFQVSVVTLRLS